MRVAPAFFFLFLAKSPEAAEAAEGSCANKRNCASCLRKSGCTWFEDMGYCETGCGLNGCGASQCASEFTTCADCLGGPGTPASGQYSWTPDSGAAGECLSSCYDAPADGRCYKAKSSMDPSGYDPSICPSISVCKARTSCTDCLDDGACAWSEGECFDSCNDWDVPQDTGCYEGDTFKPADVCQDTSFCKGIGTNCRKCMRKGCAWSEGQCYDSCSDYDVPQDTGCYEGDGYDLDDVCQGGSPNSFCEGIGSNCRKCMRKGCAWSEGQCYDSCSDYAVPQDTGCYEGDGYDLGDVCRDGADVPPQSFCESIGTNCRKCMRKGCAWSEGQCYDDCTYIADAACWPSSDFGTDICRLEGHGHGEDDDYSSEEAYYYSAA